MAGQRGYRKVDTYEYKDGTKYDIKISMEDSTFHSKIGDKIFQASSLSIIKKELETYLNETNNLQFEHLIAVVDHFNYTKEYSGSITQALKIETVFRAIRSDGKSLFFRPQKTWNNETKEFIYSCGQPWVWFSESGKLLFPFSEENLAALDDFNKRFDEFTKVLFDHLFKPDCERPKLSERLNSVDFSKVISK